MSVNWGEREEAKFIPWLASVFPYLGVLTIAMKGESMETGYLLLGLWAMMNVGFVWSVGRSSPEGMGELALAARMCGLVGIMTCTTIKEEVPAMVVAYSGVAAFALSYWLTLRGYLASPSTELKRLNSMTALVALIMLLHLQLPTGAQMPYTYGIGAVLLFGLLFAGIRGMRMEPAVTEPA